MDNRIGWTRSTEHSMRGDCTQDTSDTVDSIASRLALKILTVRCTQINPDSTTGSAMVRHVIRVIRTWTRLQLVEPKSDRYSILEYNSEYETGNDERLPWQHIHNYFVTPVVQHTTTKINQPPDAICLQLYKFSNTVPDS